MPAWICTLKTLVTASNFMPQTPTGNFSTLTMMIILLYQESKLTIIDARPPIATLASGITN